MSKRKIKIIELFFAIMMVAAGMLLPSPAESADMTMTTYYPALYGEYDRIRLMPRTGSDLAGTCTIGTLYVNSGGVPRYCINDGTGSGLWGNVPDLWTQSGNNIFLTDTLVNSSLKVGIGTSTPTFKLTIQDDNMIIAKGVFGSGTTVPSGLGAGSRLIWYPLKAAFRAGYVDAGQWDDASIGIYSVAMGKNTIASGAYSIVGGGDSNTASNDYTSIIGGQNNTASGLYSAVGGGQNNTASGNSAMIYGGQDNQATGDYSIIIGGRANQVNAQFSTIGGGEANSISTPYSFIGGGSTNSIDRIVDGTPGIGYGVIGGGANNRVRHDYSTIVGGESNLVEALNSTIVGGGNNIIGNNTGLVGKYSVITGGQNNTITGDYSVITGGKNNTASGLYSIVHGGLQNTASSNYSFIGGGERNTASGAYSTILGGADNIAAGDYSWAGGRNVQITNAASNSFAWGYSDDSLSPISVSTPDVFIIAPGKISGGNWNPKMGIRDSTPAAVLEVNANNTADDYLSINDVGTNVLTVKNNGAGSAVYIGVFKTVPGAGTYAMQFGNANNAYQDGQWHNGSSRKYKENIRPLSSKDAEKALDELKPVTFHYKATPHQQNAGFIAEDVPDLVAMKNRSTLSTLDIIAVLTQTIKDQEKEIKEQDQQMKNIKDQIRELKNMLGN